MNLEETRRYIERRMGDVGLSVRIDNSGYQTIQRYTSGDKERLNQLYYKLVSVGSRQEKREVNGVTIQIAIDDLRRMDEFMDHMPARLDHNNDKVDVDRLTIEQLASSLEQKVAEQIEFAVEEVRRKGPATSAEGAGTNGTDHFVAPAGGIESIIAPTPGVTTAGTPGKPCILVVDDSPTIRAAVTKALESDFELVQASDGEKGWEALCANSNIKLVVTDLMMPGMDGFALIERIRSAKVPGIAGLPIIVVTALEDPQAKVHALVAGANDFITKRTDTLELQARVVARYQLSQIVGNGEYAGGSRPAKDSGPPPHEVAAALLGTRSLNTFGRQSMNIAGAAKRYGKVNKDSSDGIVAAPGSVNGDARAMMEAEQAGNRSWLSALGLNRLSQMSSTTGITLLASVVVVALILGIFYVNRSSTEVTIGTLGSQAAEKMGGSADPVSTNAARLDDPAGTPKVSEEQRTASAENAGSWATADGSPTHEKLTASFDEATAPPPRKEEVPAETKSARVPVRAAMPAKADVPPKNETESVATMPVEATAPVKADVPPKSEAKSVATVAQALPKADKESIVPAAKVSAARAAVDVPTSTLVQTDRPQAIPTDRSVKLVPADVGNSASTAIAEPERVATSSTPGLTESPLLNTSPSNSPAFDGSNSNTATKAPELLVATVGPPRADGAASSSTRLTKAELSSLIKRFVFVYQAGDLQQFLSLFDDNIRTNDRTTKAGLRQDYEDLFRNTSMRQMVLGDISWDIKDQQAEGAANFEVRVRRVNEQEVRVYQGSLTFHVEKADGKIRINRMYHGQWKAQG